MKILANDGISQSGVTKLDGAGFEVITINVAQEQLINYINKEHIDVLLVRSATKVYKDVINSCPSLKIIGRGGVGMDNIDVDYAKEKNLKVINTPTASSESVAELVFAHLFSGVRFLYKANREMPLNGDSKFKELKKNYTKGRELKGKTLGIIGLGRIGSATAKVGFSLGMKVIGHDPYLPKSEVKLKFFDGRSLSFEVISQPLDAVLKVADFITLHVPSQEGYIVGSSEIAMMKDQVAIINAARGGILDEKALLVALDSGKISFAGLDVFESEPSPDIKLLRHPKVSLTPHIGAATNEAQDRIGTELAEQIISLLK